MSDMPPPTPPADVPPTTPADKSWAAIVSLIAGIVSIVPGGCCCLLAWPMAIAAIVFGVLGLKSQKSMMAKIGIGLAVLGFLIPLVIWLLNVIFHIAVPGARNP